MSLIQWPCPIWEESQSNFCFLSREESVSGPVYRGEQGEVAFDLRYAAPLLPFVATSTALTTVDSDAQQQRCFSALARSPVETLIESELQSLQAASHSFGSSSSCVSDAKSLEEDMEEDEDDDIDFYCNESIEDLKHNQHRAADGSTSSAVADDLDDEGFFDRPAGHDDDDNSRRSSVIVESQSTTQRRICRNLMPFSWAVDAAPPVATPPRPFCDAAAFATQQPSCRVTTSSAQHPQIE